MLNRDDALRLWHEHNHEDSLLRHALSVEASMAAAVLSVVDSPQEAPQGHAPRHGR